MVEFGQKRAGFVVAKEVLFAEDAPHFVGLAEEVLIQDFYGVLIFGSGLLQSGQVDLAEGSLAKLLSKVKVFYCNLILFCLLFFLSYVIFLC